MQQIDHFVSVESPTTEFDPHTPVTITWPRYRAILDPLLTRVFGDEGGYLELKCDAGSGELVEFVLMSASGVRVADSPDWLPVDNASEPVVPCFDLSVAGTELSPPTQEVTLDVVAYLELLEIRFPRAAAKITGAGPVRFAVDDGGRLAALRVEWTADQRNAFLADLPS